MKSFNEWIKEKENNLEEGIMDWMFRKDKRMEQIPTYPVYMTNAGKLMDKKGIFFPEDHPNYDEALRLHKKWKKERTESDFQDELSRKIKLEKDAEEWKKKFDREQKERSVIAQMTPTGRSGIYGLSPGSRAATGGWGQ